MLKRSSIVWLPVGTKTLLGAEADPVDLRERVGLARVRRAGQRRGRFVQQLRDAAGLPAGEQRPRLRQPRFGGRDQAGQLGDGRAQLDRLGAQRRQRAVEADQRLAAVLQRRREAVNVVERFSDWAARAPVKVSKLTISPCRSASRLARAPKVRPAPATSRDRSPGLVPRKALVTWAL